MSTPPALAFGPFRLDPADASLRRGAKRLPITPKDFAILHELVAHAGQLVSKEALLRAAWPDTHVAATVLKVCVRRVRQALGDRPDAPRFVETVHRRGYRFIAPVTTVAPVADSRRVAGERDRGALPSGRELVVGRQA